VIVVAFAIGSAATLMPLTDYFSSGELYRYLARTMSRSTGMATLPGVFHGNPAKGIVNSSIWTLKYEVICYGLLAVAGGLVMRAELSRALALVAGISWLAFVFWSQSALRESNGLIENIRYFVLFFGVGVGAYGLRRVTRLSVLAAIALVGLALAAHQTMVREATMAISLAYAMLVVVQIKLGAVGTYTNRNDYSFGFYLYSVPLTQAVFLAVPGIGMAPLIAAALVLSSACAHASWVFIERPALGWRKRVLKCVKGVAGSHSLLAGVLGAAGSGNSTDRD
jgi:peptidoglycan/LPS O-acetylase OafA/YrhL